MPKTAFAVVLALVVVGGATASAQTAPPDIVILLDTTGDMGGPIANLKSAFLSTIVPNLAADHPGIGFGVSFFRDFPVAPYGQQTPPPPDEPYVLVQPVTTNTLTVQTAINSASAGGGGDDEESGHEALYQLASGAGVSWPGGSVAPSNVGFRGGSRRLAIVVTTAVFHESYAGIVSHSADDALSALTDTGVKVASVSVNTAMGNVARPGLEAYARSTGARVPATLLTEGGQCPTAINGATRLPDPDGTCPLVFDVASNGAGLGSAIVAAVGTLLNDLVFQDGFNAGP